LSEEAAAEISRLSTLAFRAIGCRGYARVDYMVAANGTPYFTELNTLPGMTDLSDLPAQAKEAGVSYPRLVEMILESATLSA
jgi:D-alanine-D-alanine ligase